MKDAIGKQQKSHLEQIGKALVNSTNVLETLPDFLQSLQIHNLFLVWSLNGVCIAAFKTSKSYKSFASKVMNARNTSSF